MKTSCFVDENGRVERVFRIDVDQEIPTNAVAIDEHILSQLLANTDLRYLDGEIFAISHEVTPAAVNAERQRRIVRGKIIDGIHVTGSDDDARNLTNLALSAQVRMAGGDTTSLTTYRDGDNIDHDLTPAQMLSLWQQSSAYVSAIYAASWALKAMDPIPADFAGDSYWP